MMLFEISKNLGKSSVTHILLTEEQSKNKIKIYKTFIKLRYAKKSPPVISIGSRFAILNSHEMLKN